MKLTLNTYAVTGLAYIPPWTVNSGFITGSKSTLVIDAGPSYFAAQTIYGYAKNVKPGNDIILVNSEKHFDHIGGNCYFKENGCPVYGHPDVNRSPEEFAEDNREFNDAVPYPERKAALEGLMYFKKSKLVNPDAAPADGFEFDLGESFARVIYTPGHTSSNLSIYYPADKVLFCGDCIVNAYMPNLSCGGVMEWKQWIKSLNKIESLDIDFIVPGHGFVISRGEVPGQIKRMKDILTNAIYRK